MVHLNSFNLQYQFIRSNTRQFSQKLIARRNMQLVATKQEWEGLRIDKVLQNNFQLSWSSIQKLVREKDIFVQQRTSNGNEDNQYVYKNASYKINQGDCLCLSKHINIDPQEQIEKANISELSFDQRQKCIRRLKQMIVYENDHVIVINKDNGIPSQMGSGLSLSKEYEISVDNMLLSYCSEGRLVHRLDRKTSGLMALAKTKEMATWLTQRLRERQINKIYFALLCGIPKFESGIIRQNSENYDQQWEVESLNKKRTIMRSKQLQYNDQVKFDMISRYKVISTSTFDKLNQVWNNINFDKSSNSENYSLIQFELETGKKHQIRQASTYALQSPIFGDFKYSFDSQQMSKNLIKSTLKYSKNIERQLFNQTIFLHSFELHIPTLPNSHEIQVFQGQNKPNMDKILKALKMSNDNIN